MTTTLTLLILTQLPTAEDPHRMFAAGPTDAYYMEPPEMVSKPYVRRLQWMADDSTLLVERLVPPLGISPLALANARQTDGLSGMMQFRPRIQVIGWGARTRTARTFLDLDSKRARIEWIEAMPKSDQALISMEERPVRPDGTDGEPVYSYSLLSGSTGNLRRLWSGAFPIKIMLSPNQAVGALYMGPRQGPMKIVLFGSDARLGTPIALPPKANFGFTSKGQPGVGIILTNPKGKRYWEFRLINPATGALGAVAEEAGFEPAPSLFRVSEIRGEGEMNGLLLEVVQAQKEERARKEFGILTSDGVCPAVSPRNDVVAFISGQSAFVRALLKIKRSDYDTAMIDADRQKAMRNAKQVGLALAMYSGDADDAFPPGGDIRESVMPYVKNRSMLDGFTYTYGGGTVSGNPSTTELGYVGTVGGRMVVYADGSVKFVPDAP